jgi:hypothetical protein
MWQLEGESFVSGRTPTDKPSELGVEFWWRRTLADLIKAALKFSMSPIKVGHYLDLERIDFECTST